MVEMKRLNVELERLLANAKNRQAATEALAFLFPKLGNILSVPTVHFPVFPDGTPRRSISRADFAHSYFKLTPDDTAWGKSEAVAMARGAPQEAFDSFRARLARTEPRDKVKLRGRFINLLSEIARQSDQRLAWFMALIDNFRTLLDAFPETNLGLFDLEIDSQIRILLVNILMPLDETERGEVISHAITHAADISFVCGVFRHLVGDVQLDGAKGRLTNAFGPETDKLRNRLVGKVVDVANTFELYTQVRPQDILWFWWGAGHGDDVRRHTTEALGETTALRSLLEISINTVISSTGSYELIDHRSWSKIVDLEKLHQRALKISSDPGNPNYDVSRRFLSAYNRGAEDDS